MASDRGREPELPRAGEPGKAGDAPSPRAECLRCLRPSEMCLCSLIPRVENRTGIRILQHAREARHPVGTVRLAELAMEQLEVAVHRPGRSAPVDLASWLVPGAALLFPSSEAKDLEELAPDERPTSLVVLDGTWAQARVLLRRYPALGVLPRVRLEPEQPGRYQVRREPRRECLATVEAIVGALRILEPETRGLDSLERAFLAMVEGQAKAARAGNRRRRRARRRQPTAALPALFAEAPERLILAHGEFSYRIDPAAPGGRRVDVLQWCAHRWGTDERFAALVRPREAPPSEAMLGHMGLTRIALDAGLEREAFLEGWRRFLRPGDQVAVWSAAIRDALGLALADEAPGALLLLKTAYCNVRHGQAGDLATVLSREGLEAAAEPFAGRAGAIMGQLQAVAELLVTLARRSA